MRFTKIEYFLLVLLGSNAALASEKDVLVHPPFSAHYTCSEHWSGQFKHLGDALGTDCSKLSLVTVQGKTWSRLYVGTGTKNSDWFSWKEPIFAPTNAQVKSIHINTVTNEPGVMNSERASSITLEAEDGTMYLLAHIREPMVAIGQIVSEGQPIALAGNNGYSRNPHVHIGAWRGDNPLQIRFDQTKLKMKQ